MNTSLRALVTGASRGIGRAIAQQLAARGCQIVVHYRENRAAADATLQSLAGTGHVAVAADLSQPDEVARLWQEATAAFGAIDIVVNNAGIYETHPPLSTGFAAWCDVWQRTLAANLDGPAHLSLLAVQAMAAKTTFLESHGRGRVINISSRGAFRGEPEAPAYAASKAGLNAMSQSFARALAPHSIYVYCLAPTWVETDLTTPYLSGPTGADIIAQHPMGRVVSTAEIARAAVFCAMDAPPAMTGSIIDLNGASYLRT